MTVTDQTPLEADILGQLHRLDDRFDQYLQAKKAQLWDGPGMLTDPKGRVRARDWFLTELAGFLAYLREEGLTPAA